MLTMKRRDRGFTLIELLVVISIIAVLISILLPALSGAVQAARKVKCQASMRSIGSTAQAYAADDPNGVIGPIHPSFAQFIYEGYAEYGGGPGTMRFVGWMEDNANNHFDPRTRPFNRLIYGPNGIGTRTAPGDVGQFQEFQCAGEDYGWQEMAGFGTNPLETETPYYKANGVAFRLNNLQWNVAGGQGGGFVGGAPTIRNVGVYGRSVNRVPDTSQVMFLFETRVFQTLWTNDAWGTLGSGGAGRITLTGNHKRLGFFNTLYVDGHADFANFGPGTYYRQMWEYQQLDARGSWGRFDNWPDPPVPF